jgi:GDP-L-fucose synthase
MSRYLVTGGTGLLGSAYRIIQEEKDADLSTDEHDKTMYLSRKECDLTDKIQVALLFKRFNPTHVVHLAARVGGLYDNLRNNAEFFEKNVLINLHVLAECNKSRDVVKVLSCMSTCIFPKTATLPLTVEKLHTGLPHHSNLGYSFAKRMIDVENRMLYRPEKPFLGIIPTNMFGPRDNFDIQSGHVIPALISKCFHAKENGLPFIVKGSGKALRQFVYSLDAARIIHRLMKEYTAQEPVIIAGPEEVSVQKVARMIARVMNFTGEIHFVSQKEEGQERKTAQCSIPFLFPDFHFTKLETALKETIESFLLSQK